MMKLSEAIRLGAMLGEQLFGKLFGEDGASCALGSAIRSAGLNPNWKSIGKYFPILLMQVSHPLGDKIAKVTITHADKPDEQHSNTLWAVIVSLNNEHRWTRERIADWVQTIEDSLPQSPSVERRPVQAAEQQEASKVAEETA